MPAKVEIYTSDPCPYCVRAKALLTRKGVAYTEIDLTGKPEARAELVIKAQGRKTVPQIFIDGVSVGGSDDIHALDAAGELDKLLKI